MSQVASPEDVETEVKRLQALELRIGGANVRQIAKELKIGVATAHKYVTEGLEEMQLFNAEQLRELKALMIARCESLILKLWNKRDQPRVADTILRTLEREARLMGFDAPLRWEGSGPGGGPIPLGPGEIDLAKLSLDQLKQLESIVVAASAVAQASAPVASIAPGPEIPIAEALSTVPPPAVTGSSTTNGAHP